MTALADLKAVSLTANAKGVVSAKGVDLQNAGRAKGNSCGRFDLSGGLNSPAWSEYYNDGGVLLDQHDRARDDFPAGVLSARAFTRPSLFLTDLGGDRITFVVQLFEFVRYHITLIRNDCSCNLWYGEC